MKEKLVKAFGKASLTLRKHAPEIMVIGGVIGLIGAGILACKETTKLDKVLDEIEKRTDKLAADMNKFEESDKLTEEEKKTKYTELDRKKDIVQVWTKNALDVAKLYAPSIILATASAASILGGFGILKKRHAAITFAFGEMSAAFTEFKNRTKEAVGEEKYHEILDGVKKEMKEVIDENGNVVVAEVDTIDPVKDPYTFVWDEYTTRDSGAYTPGDDNSNLNFIKSVEATANNRLRNLNGYVFLNDVLDMLGLPKTKAGQEVGWVMQPNDEHQGDNYIDFGIKNIDDMNKETMKFTRRYILHFNCDGYILDTFQDAFKGEK